MPRLGALLLVLALWAAAGVGAEDPAAGPQHQGQELEAESEDGLRILEADVPRRGDEVAIERQTVRRVSTLAAQGEPGAQAAS